MTASKVGSSAERPSVPVSLSVCLVVTQGVHPERKKEKKRLIANLSDRGSERTTIDQSVC